MFYFILFLLSNYSHFDSADYMKSVVSKMSPQYVLQSEMGKSNTQYSGIFKEIDNYTLSSCVTFNAVSPGFS